MATNIQDHVDVEVSGETQKVEVELPTEIIDMVRKLATIGRLTPTEAIIQAIVTSNELVERAPNGAQIIPVGKHG